MSTCCNNPEKSSTTEKNNHTASGYSLFTNCSFDTTTKQLNYYRDKDCMEIFLKGLKEHATKTIKYEKKMIPLTNEKRKLHRMQKVCYICKKRFSTDDDNKKYYIVRGYCHYTKEYRGAAHDICNLRYNIPK